MRKTSEELKNKISLLYPIYKNSYKVAEIAGCGATTAKRILSNKNELRTVQQAQKEKPKRVIAEENLLKSLEVTDLYSNKGKSIREIHRITGENCRKIRNFINDNHLEKPRIKRKTIVDMLNSKRDEVIDLYENKKYSIPKLSDYFNISQSSIYFWLRSNNINLRKSYEQLVISNFDNNKELYQKIKDLYLIENMNIQDIANNVNSTYSCVRCAIRKMGIARSHSDTMRIAVVNEVERSSLIKKVSELYSENLFIKDIANRLNISRGVVSGILNDLELFPKDDLICLICNSHFRKITVTHLRKHNMSISEYREKFPNSKIISDESHNAQISSWTQELRVKTSARIKELYNDVNSVYNSEEYKNKRTRHLIKTLKKLQKFEINESEKYLDKVIQSICPEKYMYNGDGSAGLLIFGHPPDWVNTNGEKKLIEFNGCAWHCCPLCKKKHPFHISVNDIAERDDININNAKRLGYEVLVIWEHELRSLDHITHKIMEFINS